MAMLPFSSPKHFVQGRYSATSNFLKKLNAQTRTSFTNHLPFPFSSKQKLIRERYIILLNHATDPTVPSSSFHPLNITWPLHHDLHCFDTLRQHIMCNADDTLLYTTGHRDAGHHQPRQCRNWDALREWATRHTACYHDFEAKEGETRWSQCDGGDDGLPRGSLLE